MNARTSLPLLVAMTLSAAPAPAAQPAAGGQPPLAGLGNAQDPFAAFNQTAMLGGDYSAQDDMQMKQWFTDLVKQGTVVFWDESSKVTIDGVSYYTRFGQIVGDNQVSFTDGIRRQSMMPVPMEPGHKAKADEMRSAMGECAAGFIGPPRPGLDCDKILGDLAKALENGGSPPKPKDADQEQLANAEKDMWGGKDKGASGGKKSGDKGMGIMSVPDDGAAGEGGDSYSDRDPAPATPDRPSGDSPRSGGDEGDDGYADGNDIGGQSGQVGGESGEVASGGGGGAGKSSTQGGAGGKGPVKIDGNKAVAEHSAKYGDGYSFRSVGRAAQGSRRILDGAAAFAGEDEEKVRAQEAPPVDYGRMKITPSGAADPAATPTP